MWTPKEGSPIAQTWLWEQQHPVVCSALRSRTWGVGPVGGALRLDPAGAGSLSRAAPGGVSRHAVRPAPSACPARPAAPPRPTPSAWRRAHGGRLRSAAASLGTPWPGRAETSRAQTARAGGRGLQVGTAETRRGTHPTGVRLTQDGVDFLELPSPRNKPGRSEALCWLWDVKSFFRSGVISKLSSSPSGGAAGSLVLGDSAVPGPPSLASLRRFALR